MAAIGSLVPVSPHATRWSVYGLIVALVAVLGPALAAPAVHAHDQILESNPADGATLDAPPVAVVLTFNADILPIAPAVLVRDAAGAVVLDAEPAVAGPVATAPLPADLAPGVYAVSWRVVSQDGHPIQGSFTFAVADTPAPAPAAPTTTPPAGTATTPATMTPSVASPSPETSADESGAVPLAIGALAALGTVGVVVILLLRRRPTA